MKSDTTDPASRLLEERLQEPHAGPALRTACGEMGLKDCDPEKSLNDAVALLLATPEVAGAIELRPKITAYVFVDERLEALAPVQKLLIRMGPENGGKVRAKLRELASLL